MTKLKTRKAALRAVPCSLRDNAYIEENGFSMADVAARDGHPIAVLLRLREEAADEIDRLLAFLDATEGDLDLSQSCEDEGAEADVSGCGDYDGLLEQVGSQDWQHGGMA